MPAPRKGHGLSKRRPTWSRQCCPRAKTQAPLPFLLGLRRPQIAGILVAHGFGDNHLEEGWRMLREAVGARLDRTSSSAPPPVKTKQLDESENKWFPIAAAALRTP